mmetsp:Transcript_33745/g.54423  ORF Transcript_33745/g.54423 Transcript_33745/m.54423 type:complete len:353 (-) Transcript_33745:331-1389(-)
MFARTTSAPGAISMASEREQLDQMFALVKRNSIASRVDRQWQARSSQQALSTASCLMDKLNYFLVAHLKAVPLDRLPQKIRETFATIDLDQSGQLSKAEVGIAFSKLGKPLTPQDLNAYMEMVDVDGNGVVDLNEFAHMTRKLLLIDCLPSCVTCRYIHRSSNSIGCNWGANKELANKELALEEMVREECTAEAAAHVTHYSHQKAPTSKALISFSRVGSLPVTPSESIVATDEALKRRADKMLQERKDKEQQIKTASTSPSISKRVGGNHWAYASSPLPASSHTHLNSASACSPSLPPTAMPKCNTKDETHKDTRTHAHTHITSSLSPSRVSSKLHDAISTGKHSPEHRAN